MFMTGVKLTGLAGSTYSKLDVLVSFRKAKKKDMMQR